MKNIQRLLNSYAYRVFVCQYYLCISEGVSFNLHQNGMKKIRKTMIKDLTIIQLRGRTLITPSSIPDGAIENQHMAHDNCYVALSDFPMRRFHLFSVFQLTLSGSLVGSVNFSGCPWIRFTNLLFEFHWSSPTKPGCGCKQYNICDFYLKDIL